MDEPQNRTFCGVSWKGKCPKMAVFICFLAIFAAFLQIPDTSDSSIFGPLFMDGPFYICCMQICPIFEHYHDYQADSIWKKTATT